MRSRRRLMPCRRLLRRVAMRPIRTAAYAVFRGPFSGAEAIICAFFRFVQAPCRFLVPLRVARRGLGCVCRGVPATPVPYDVGKRSYRVLSGFGWTASRPFWSPLAQCL